MAAISTLFSIVEVVTFCLCFFVWLRRYLKSCSVAITIALSITSGLALISFLFQLGFLVRFPEAIPVLEVIALASMVWLTWGNWSAIGDIRGRFTAIWQVYPRILTILAILLVYLGLQAILLPPSSWDALVYHLPRVLLWEQNRSLFLQNFTTAPQTVFPVGADILFHLFLRFQLDYGLGLFSWLSYLVILFGTYGFVRSRMGRSIALTSAIAISCLPEIIYQAPNTKNDIIIAAVALACVLWADQWLQVPSVESLIGLGLTLCFGISVKTSFVLFIAFFLPLWLSLVVQQGKLFLLLGSTFKEWRAIGLAMGPGLILSQCWLFAYNYHQFGNWLGPKELILKNQNNEGLLGGVANLVRYGFQSVHLLRPVEELFKFVTGWSMVDALQTIYDKVFDPLFGNAGQAEFIKWQLLEISWLPLEGTSWFGPVSLFLVFPSVIWCVLNGRKFSRLMAIVAIGLVLAISYKVGWSPWKSRFFTMAIVCTGICVATALKQFYATEWKLSSWRWLSIGIAVYACFYNYSKPVLLLPNDSGYGNTGLNNIWVHSDWTRDREIYERIYNGDQSDFIHQFLSDAERVAFIGYGHYFSMMIRNPDVQFFPLKTESPYAENHALEAAADQLRNVDHLVCFQKPCMPEVETVKLSLLWENKARKNVPQVYKVQANYDAPLNRGYIQNQDKRVEIPD